MKKFLVTLSIVMTLGFSANAQMQSVISSSDGFFSSNTTTEENREGETGLFPTLPGRGIADDQDADAPLGSGLLILAGLGVAYAARRRE